MRNRDAFLRQEGQNEYTEIYTEVHAGRGGL